MSLFRTAVLCLFAILNRMETESQYRVQFYGLLRTYTYAKVSFVYFPMMGGGGWDLGGGGGL
jgi:hypothetical protein